MISSRTPDGEQVAKHAVSYIMNFMGIQYHWGGDDALEGFDCSGLVMEMLKMTGMVSENQDYTAEGLRQFFRNKEALIPKRGVLVFYGKDTAKHVAICIDEKTKIEAGGGNSRVDDEESAKKFNAFVKLRPISNRDDFMCYLDPFAY